MPEYSDFDDWVPRTIARELVRIALQCDVVEAEERLIIHMRDLPPDEWRFRLWSAQITVAKEGIRRFPSLSEEVAKTFKFRFWREVDVPRDGARIHVGGNRAAYAGPLLVTAAEYTIRPPPKGVIVPDSLIVVDGWRQIEARVGDIALRLGPLASALRNAGYPVEMALARLVEEKLLTAALVDSLSSPPPIIPSEPAATGSVVIASEPKGPLKHRVPAALEKSIKPLPGEGYEDWAKRALPDANPHSVATILSNNKDEWKKAGGAPPKRGRKPKPN